MVTQFLFLNIFPLCEVDITVTQRQDLRLSHWVEPPAFPCFLVPPLRTMFRFMEESQSSSCNADRVGGGNFFSHAVSQDPTELGIFHKVVTCPNRAMRRSKKDFLVVFNLFRPCTKVHQSRHP